MLNCFRADAYRLLHGKALFISLVVFLAMIVGQLLAGDAGTVGVQMSAAEVSEAPGGAGALAGILAAMGQFQTMVLFALALIYAIAAADFSSGAVQNSIAAGMPRSRLYLSKLITSFVFIELFYLASLLVGALIGSIESALGVGSAGAVAGAGVSAADVAGGAAAGAADVAGAGAGAADVAGAATADGAASPTIASLLCAFGAQSLIALAIAATGVAITFISRKGAVLNTAYLVVFIGGNILLSALQHLTHTHLAHYDFVVNSIVALNIYQLPAADALRVIAIPIAYLTLSTLLGLSLFRKAEVK
ncbi:MAG: hypothetical protein LBP28_08750 [Coriobacteriales bacterium]|jgi:hypothetical protein|nr:hypothetical protein [Coriobacteriales bacterium]